MHDLAFVAFLLLYAAFGVKRPFIFVLAYVYVDIVAPQRLTYYLLNSVQVSLIFVALAVAGWVISGDKRDVRIAPRQVLMLLLLVYCGLTTTTAAVPAFAADKWSWVWKSLAFAIFLPLTLNTRLRIEALLMTMVLSASSIIVVGGIKTAAGGGGYGTLRLLINNNTGLYEGSTISTVAIAIIPIIFWAARYGTVFKRSLYVYVYAAALAFACLLIPIGTVTRTGLICTLLLGLLMLRDTKQRAKYLAIAAVLTMVAIPMLPNSYKARMGLIKGYQGDESASTRVAVWSWTLGYVSRHPFGGGFEVYRTNRLQVTTHQVSTDGGQTEITNTVNYDKGRAFHSAYFEVLGEQGWPGLFLWLSINVAGLFRMEVLRQRMKRAPLEFEWIRPLASALQSAQLIYMVGATFIAIAYQPFIYMLIGAQIGLDGYARRAVPTGPVSRRARRQAEQARAVPA